MIEIVEIIIKAIIYIPIIIISMISTLISCCIYESVASIIISIMITLLIIVVSGKKIKTIILVLLFYLSSYLQYIYALKVNVDYDKIIPQTIVDSNYILNICFGLSTILLLIIILISLRKSKKEIIKQ